MATAATTQDPGAVSDADIRSSVLGTDSAATETATATETESPAGGGEESTRDVDQATEETGAEEAAATEEEAAEAQGAEEETETEFAIGEGDRDYSDAAYERAAQHYSKQFGREFDLSNTGDRAILHELISRGEKIKELQSAREEEPTEEAAAEEAPTEEVRQAPTVEQVLQNFARTQEYAKQSIVPEVAKAAVFPLMKAITNFLYPGKNIDLSDRTPEQFNEVAAALSAAAILQINDAIPSLLKAVPDALYAGDPVMKEAREVAVRESAFEAVIEATGQDGKPLYPEFEALEQSGAIARVFKSNPDLKNAVFDRDPARNFQKKLETAYKIARGERVNTNTVRRAVETGKRQAAEAADRAGAARLAPGGSRGGFREASTRDQDMKRGILTGADHRFEDAVREAYKK